MTPDEREIYDCGVTIFRTHSVRRNLMSVWVDEVAFFSGQRVAWFSEGGHLVVKVVGNVERARIVVHMLKNMHDSFFAACCSIAGPDEINSMLTQIWSDNKVI